MAFNNGFPVGYQPAQIYYPQQAQNIQPSQQNNGIIWVQGEAGAKSYLVAPNTTVQLWDSEAQVIYLKSADTSGMPSMKIIDYTIRDNSSQPLSSLEQTNYATKDDIITLKEELDQLKNKIKTVSKKGGTDK